MQDIFKKYKIIAKKSLWQNFLTDEKILSEISSITNIEWESILEIWPWFWALTWLILDKNPKSLTLVELDKDMIEILNDRVKNNDLDISKVSNFEIINQDVLKIEPELSSYKVIANIPYYITSPILFKFLYEVKNKPTEMIILMQKEVWERIIGIEKNKKTKSSVLSLFVQKKCTVSPKIDVLKNCFVPAPKVDSIVLHFKLNDDNSWIDDNVFLAFIKASFSNPRKKLISNLVNAWYEKEQYLAKLKEMWFDENVRGEELGVEDYMGLIR